MDTSSSLPDLTGLTIEELTALVSEDELERALDRILDGRKDSVGHHGFNSKI